MTKAKKRKHVSACVDKATDCSQYVNAECKLSSYRTLMASKCAKTCGLCSSVPACVDSNTKQEIS